MFKRLLLTLLLITQFLLSMAGELPEYAFTSYNTDFGFVRKEVMRIMQDDNGQMWFATWDGIYRFDGYRFSNYKARPGDGIRMESNRLESIIGDGKYIWMRSYNGSVSRFSIEKGTIENIPLENYSALDMVQVGKNGVLIQLSDGRVAYAASDEETGKITLETFFSKGQTSINKLEKTSDGRIWILARHGVWCFDTKTKKTTQICRGYNCLAIASVADKVAFACSRGTVLLRQKGRVTTHKLPTSCNVRSVLLLPDGGLLAATDGDGLYKLSPAGIVEKHFTTKNSVLPSDNLSAIRQDSHGDAWFCTRKPGVMRYCATSGQLFLLTMSGEFSSDATMWRNDIKMAEDSRGTLWVSPSGNGMAIYDRQNNCLVPFLDKNRHNVWTAENTVTDMFVDRQDNIWFCGKYTGLQKATHSERMFHTIERPTATESGHDVRGIFRDSKGRLWFGARSGVISVYDSSLRFLGNLTTDGCISPNAEDQMGHAYSFAQEKNGVIWIATKFKGLIRLQPKADGTYAIRHFLADGKPFSICHNDVFSLAIDHHNRLWIATFGGGIAYLSLSDPQFRFIHAGNHLRSYPISRFSRTRFITADRHGDIWVGTSSGILRFKENFVNPRKISYKAYTRNPDDATTLSYNDVLEISFSHLDSMYVCTYGGGFCHVERCQGDSLRFRPYTTANGLRSDVLFSAAEDRQGNLWFATENGLIRYSPRHNRIENFTTSFLGKQIDINEGTAVSLPDGRLLFPSRNCTAMYFDPLKVRVSTFVPQIIFTRLFVEQKEQQPGGEHGGRESILKNDINSTESLVLPRGVCDFGIEFAALDYRNPQNISYSYKLEGHDDAWIANGNRHDVIYNSLPAGRYTLKIRSTNSDGVWVDNERQIEIVVRNPFWLTGWAFLLYFIAAGVILGCPAYLAVMRRRIHKAYIDKYVNKTVAPPPTDNVADRQFIEKLTKLLEDNISNSDLSVDDVASMMGMSRSVYFKKLKSLTGIGPNDYLKSLRMQRAAELLDTGLYSMTDISYKVGISDPHYFSKCFKQKYGLTPTEWRKRAN